MTEHQKLLRIIAMLFIDEEFARRLQLLNGDALEPLEAYLRDRGASQEDAALLGMMYLAGSTHTMLATKRALERIVTTADTATA